MWTDVREFRSLIQRCLEASACPGSPDETKLLAEAVVLHRREFLAGFYLKDSPSFEEWQFIEQESLERDYAGALERLITSETASGRRPSSGCSSLAASPSTSQESTSLPLVR